MVDGIRSDRFNDQDRTSAPLDVWCTILGVGVGWLVGGANADTRRVLALSTGTRNFTVALVVASQSFDDPRVEIMVIVAAVVGLLIVLPVCWVWGMRPVASG